MLYDLDVARGLRLALCGCLPTALQQQRRLWKYGRQGIAAKLRADRPGPLVRGRAQGILQDRERRSAPVLPLDGVEDGARGGLRG